MTGPRDNEPMGADDVAELGGLDLALDELAAGRDLPAEGTGGEAAALAALAAELSAAVPAPPPGAAERGRAAFLAAAGGGRSRGPALRRSLPLRLAGLAAAAVVLVALPAAARQADPGTALWPVREVGQQVRDRLADDPVRRANLRLNTAEEYIAAAAGAGEERRDDMADAAEDKIKDALDALKDRSGPRVAAVRARAIQLEAQVEGVERQKDDDSSGPGGTTEPGDDNSGPGGGDDSSGDDNSGPGSGGSGSGPGSGSGKGSSGSGSGSGSGSSGSESGSGSRETGSGRD